MGLRRAEEGRAVAEDTSAGSPAPAGGRRRRRAVGPAGAPPPGSEPRLDLPAEAPVVDDDERLRRDRPPHHDQGV